MDTKSVPAKFMRPRPYAERISANWRTVYRYVNEGVIPAYKFQGLLLIDVDEADSIIKGLVRHVPKPIKRPGKVGRPRKTQPQTLEPAAQ